MLVLGLGSNQGDRINNLREALRYLNLIEDFKIIQISPVYKSDALLPENAPQSWDQFYLNVNISGETTLSPPRLLKNLKQIEHNMGRDKTLVWGPRIIDIDILVWEDCLLNTEELTIPHPQLHHRPFVLLPLIDLLPDWKGYIVKSKMVDAIIANLNKWDTKYNSNIPHNTHKVKHRIDIPQLMGIINVTPDSFSNHGQNLVIDVALHNCIRLFNEGAEILDLGAESTRPGAIEISPEEEWNRLKPVLQTIVKHWQGDEWKPKISIDTRHYEVAERAISFGVNYINDVSGFVDYRMCAIVAAANTYAIYMHNLGIPADQNKIIPQDKDLITEILQWANQRKEKMLQAGIRSNKIIFDPGIGFGKNARQSLQLIRNIDEIHAVGVPLLVGHSRKSFLNLCTDQPFAQRDYETAVVSEFLANHKVQYLRIHNVEHNMRNLSMQTFLGRINVKNANKKFTGLVKLA